MDGLKMRGSWFKTLSMLSHFIVFFYFFLFFIAKLIKHIILSRNVFFFSFSGGIRGFFILTRDLEKTQVFQFSSRKNPRGVTTV